MWYTNRVWIHSSARKHGISDDDIRHAMVNPIREVELSEDRWLVIGPDRSANLLELIVIITDRNTEIVIHAISLTNQHWRFLS